MSPISWLCTEVQHGPDRTAWRTAVSILGATITVSGCCMVPFLQDRQVVTIAPLAGRIPEVGQVVYGVAENEDEVIHRVVARWRLSGWRFFVASDDCRSLDFMCRDQVLGILSSESVCPAYGSDYWRDWQRRHSARCVFLCALLLVRILRSMLSKSATSSLELRFWRLCRIPTLIWTRLQR